MHIVDLAQRVMSAEWPKEPMWIYESPDGGSTVYRRLLVKGVNNRLNPLQRYMVKKKQVKTLQELNEEYYRMLYEHRN
jgi:hypothetical protein